MNATLIDRSKNEVVRQRRQRMALYRAGQYNDAVGWRSAGFRPWASLIAVVSIFSVCSVGRSQTRMSYTGQLISDGNGQSRPASVQGYSNDSSTSQKSRAGKTMQESPDTSGVQSNEVVKVYGIGRYVDSSDPRLMHERHAVYRLEESQSWRLQPPAHQPEVLMGPIVGLRRPEYAPEPVLGEVGRDLVSTRQNTQAAIDGVRKVTEDQVKIRQELNENLKRVSENEEALVKEIASLKRRLDEVDGRPKQTQNEQNPVAVTPGTRVSER